MSATEGSGKLLNYMAVGLPTIAFDTPVSREYLGYAGRYAPQMTPDSFAVTLNHLLDASDEWPELGDMLRKRVCANFSWERAGEQLSEIYDLICE